MTAAEWASNTLALAMLDALESSSYSLPLRRFEYVQEAKGPHAGAGGVGGNGHRIAGPLVRSTRGHNCNHRFVPGAAEQGEDVPWKRKR
jgi:hypothetical protein